MIKRSLGFIFIAAISFALSYVLNYFFLNLPQRDELDQALMLFFLTCALTFIFFFLWVDGVKFEWNIKTPRFDSASLRENLPGILLSLFFVFVYLYFGRVLNNFGVGQVDNLFDADVSSWMRRISSPDVKEFEMRGPHPFTYFIFRPFGLFLNLFTRDPILSAILFNAIIGGVCVFLAWLFIKRQFESKTYAFLIAALLGLSASHLFLGSVVETYIFSAAALLLFVLLIQSEKTPAPALIAAGVLTFGITLTNFVQNFINFIFSRPRLREIIRFTGWVIAVSLLLTYLHAIIYPASKIFFLTPDIENEEKFFAGLTKPGTPQWFIIGRLMFLVRTLLLYSVAAPKVFILTTEVGSTIPEFRFYKISIGTFHQTSYDGLGQILIIIWALMLAVAGIVFLWRLIRTRKLELSFALGLCILFNFLIHVNYGQEFFLYTPDWAYALILFVAFGLSPFAKNRFFQLGMFVFLIMLAYNQWQFMNTIIHALEEFMLQTS